jgi:hypothetical protein
MYTDVKMIPVGIIPGMGRRRREIKENCGEADPSIFVTL